MTKKLNLERMIYCCPLCNQNIEGKFRMSKYHQLLFSCSTCVTSSSDSRFILKINNPDGTICNFTYVDDNSNTLFCDSIGVEITTPPKYNIVNISEILPESFFDSDYNFFKDKADKYIKYRVIC